MQTWGFGEQARTVSKTVYRTVEAVGKGISYVARGVGKAVGYVAKAGFNIAKGVATSVYNGGMAVLSGAKKFFSWATSWWRRRKRHRQARGDEAADSTSSVANGTSGLRAREEGQE